ncbi:MAG: hypothetical protein HXS40_05140, partial [Theionarchaea archaeon]|nr:hypothetical protein [Theionarchaea archaeon]
MAEKKKVTEVSGMDKELEQQLREAERSAGILMTTLRRFIKNKAGIVGLGVFLVVV